MKAKIFDLQGPKSYRKMMQRIFDLCGQREDPRKLVALSMNEPYEEFKDVMEKEGFDLSNILHLASEEKTIKHDAMPERTIELTTSEGIEEKVLPAREAWTSTIESDFSLGSYVAAHQIADMYYKGHKNPDGTWLCQPKELGAVVSLYQNPETREKYLDVISKLPIEVFFVDLNWPDEPDEMTQRGGVGSLFDTREEFDALGADLAWVVEGIAHEEEITVVGGLPKDFKTWFLLSVVKSLLTGEALFGYFKVARLAERVLYFIPEASRRSFLHRLRIMKLDQFIGSTLFVRTLSKGPAPTLDDPAVMESAKGADVFLDTVSRFATGDENAAQDVKNFSAQLFGMLETGARSVWAAHHSPKAFGEASKMTLENMLRGSGDIGAMLSNAYGLRKLDEDTGLVHVECLAGRDLPELVKPFQLRARPHLNDYGSLWMSKKPGEAGSLGDYVGKKNGRPDDPRKEEKLQMVLDLHQQGKGLREIAKATGVPKSTVSDWISDSERPLF
jgi:AAA domain/Homeodomain-like domain